jgi:integral membrane protein (TIGR01906 family)
MPFVILMLAIRCLITPIYAKIEYRLPGFPEDPYGFTREERLDFAKPSINYLVNSEDLSFLEALQFDNGDPIYTERELSHMADVKQLVTGMRYALAGGAILIFILTLTIAKLDQWKSALRAILWGAWGEFVLIGGILLFIVLSFDFLFTLFHKLFFESGTWTFYTSDTLIRLFPMRFWRDAFLSVGGLSILFALIIIFISRRKLKN